MPRPAWKALSAELNVTPMLDVLLVLLVIFMAAVQSRKAMDVQLPAPCTGVCPADGTPIVLEVLPDGVYLLNREPVAADHLARRLRDVYAGRPTKIVQVVGHRSVRYQRVLDAMDVARSAGVEVIGIPPSEISSR